MNNNNGKKLFFAIVGVAALVTATIGATFAYFVVTVSGTASGVKANSYSLASNAFALAENTTYRYTNLIPVSQENAVTSYNQTGSDATAKCKGVSANDTATVHSLCSVYTFTVTNNSGQPQGMTATLKTTANGFSNLKYCVFSGTSSTPSPATCAAVPAVNATATIGYTTFASGGTATYHIVLFVNDTGGDQTASDSGKSYTGTVTVTNDYNTTHLTGILAT